VLFGMEAMLLLLAVLSLFCAWQVRRLGTSGRPITAEPSPELAPEPARSGFNVLKEAPYLRTLAALVLCGTIAAALIDYVFKAEAVGAFGTGPSLLRFFAVFYAAVSLATFALQTSMSRFALEKLGLGVATGSPSLALAVGGIGGLLVPGLGSTIVARAAEAIFRASFFRSGYELFYTPIPPNEKRAAKSLIDVGVDRVGDAFGGGIIQTVLMLMPGQASAAILFAAVGCSLLALVVASRLSRAYIETLERSLLNRAVEVDLSDVEDLTTRTVMLRTLDGNLQAGRGVRDTVAAAPTTQTATTASSLDPETRATLALRSRDRDRVLKVLTSKEDLSPALVSHIIPLLAWDQVAPAALGALRRIAEDRIGQLVDALLDPNQEFAVRRRLARVFSSCRSQRAADAVLFGLDDQRFEVRYQCGRSLAAILKNNPDIRIDERRIYDIVVREVAVGRPVWESRRLLDQLPDHEERSFVDDFVKARTSQGLAHVFTLLSLVLPSEPLQIAYRGLHTDQQGLRGTALEYLEGVLPPIVRARLWPFLDDPRPASRPARPREQILEELLRSNASIVLNLEELERRNAAGTEPWQRN
jgi:hypothetical protein